MGQLIAAGSAATSSTDSAVVASVPENYRGVNVRQEPNLNSPIVTVLDSGEEAPVTASAGDGLWVRVDLGGGLFGWISTAVIDIQGQLGCA